MSVSVKSISLSIGGSPSSGYNMTIAGGKYHAENFTLHQSLMTSNSLSFVLCKDPEESVDDPQFSACGELIGKSVDLQLDTFYVAPKEKGGVAAIVEFHGFIISATGSRSGSEYQIYVEARSGDALLDDNPNCKSYEDKTLNDIVNDVIEDYSGAMGSLSINPRFSEVIPYCVQYNESNYQFLQRLARRYGEWLYNDGTQFVFGNLVNKGSATLYYPSQDVPSYNADLRMRHVAFNHVASSYSKYDATKKDGISEMQGSYNPLSDKAFDASQEKFTKQTLQNLHSGGFAKPEKFDTRETILNISTKSQGRSEKASMLTYSGSTYCSCIKLGSTVLIIDNYLATGALDSRSPVNQYEILITELTHHFDIDHTYSNHFVAIPSQCDYPPYADFEAYPYAPSCRAKVKDNEDPENLGRIRVQFDWQAQYDDADQPMWTPWIRMAQPYAGGGKGFSFIPEKEEEVMIDFEGGNAERPFVKGTLYNGVDDVDQKWVANKNEANKIKAIRTRNGHTIEVHDEGSDGYIRIYDNEKENYILTFSTDRKLIMLQSTGNIELYAQNDIIMHAGHDISASAGHDITTNSGHDTAESAGNDMFLEAGNDQQRTAGNDIREAAGQDRTTNIERNDSLSVTENQFIKIGDNKDEQIEHKLQLTAENIRTEAEDQLLEYSKTHHMKASDQTAINAGTRIDIKAGIVKVQ